MENELNTGRQKLLNSRHDNGISSTSDFCSTSPEVVLQKKMKQLEFYNEDINSNDNGDDELDNGSTNGDNELDNVSTNGDNERDNCSTNGESNSEDEYISASSDDDLGAKISSDVKIRINGLEQSHENGDVVDFPANDDVVFGANLGQPNRIFLNQLSFWPPGRPRSLSRISEGSHASADYETKDDFHLLRHHISLDANLGIPTNQSEVPLTGSDSGLHNSQPDAVYDAQLPEQNVHKSENTLKSEILNKSFDTQNGEILNKSCDTQKGDILNKTYDTQNGEILNKSFDTQKFEILNKSYDTQNGDILNKSYDTQNGDILNKSYDTIVSGNIRNSIGNITKVNKTNPQINIKAIPTYTDLASLEVASESTPKPSDNFRFEFPIVQTDSNTSHFDTSVLSGNMKHPLDSESVSTTQINSHTEPLIPTIILTEATVHSATSAAPDIPLSLMNLVFLTKSEAPPSPPEINNLTLLNPGSPITVEGKRSNLKKKPFTPTLTLPPTAASAASFDGSSSSLNAVGSKKSIKWGSDITDTKKTHNEPQASIPQEKLKPQTASKVNGINRDNSRRGVSAQHASAMDIKDDGNLSGTTQSGKESKSSRRNTTNVADAEKLKEPDGLSSSGYSTPVRSSANGELGGNVIVRALKGIKGKNTTSSEDKSLTSIEQTDDDGVSLEMMSYSGGLSTPDDLSSRDFLTDAENSGTSFQELEMTQGRETASAGGVSDGQDEAAPSNEMDPSEVQLRASKRRAPSRVSQLFPEALRNSLVVILSGIYGIVIVVLGLVLPLSETFANPKHPYFFEIFYLYLYTLSMAFLIYVYTYLLRKEQTFLQTLPKTISRTLSRTLSRSSVRSRNSAQSDKGGPSFIKPLVGQNRQLSTNSLKRRKFAYNSEVTHHTGSFYLRVGVIGFGIGSLIHSGLAFGHYLEVSHMTNHCSDVIQAIKPLAHLCFTFVQMYFIFMNSKMCVHKYKTLARFGLMHMSCTNICVWLKSVVVETLQVIKVDQREAFSGLVKSYQQHQAQAEGDSEEEESVQTLEEYLKEHKMGPAPEVSCGAGTIMGKIVENSSVYLYPCTIEYSLVCACVLYVMWSNVGEGYTPRRPASVCSEYDTLDSDEDSDEENAHHRMSVDCAASSRGLFLGILLFVAAVVCIVCFYVLTSDSSHVSAGKLLGHISEEIILVVAFLATAIAAYQMRGMRFSAKRKVGIEEILTLVSISGLGLYGIWSIIAAVFHLHTIHGRLTLVTNLFMLVQAGSQATFTMAALRAYARNHQQLQAKPGRQCVTFLLICNFALWVVNTFETQRIEYNQTQIDFYGTTAWAIFSHISVPLGIYFRFHSTVNLSIVWKKAWKKREHHEHLPTQGQQSA